MSNRPCPPGCACKKHDSRPWGIARKFCPEGCACGRHTVKAGDRRHGNKGRARTRPTDPDARRALVNREGLRRSHGMAPEDWDAMWTAQRGRCYLCADPLPPDRRRAHIDHDHSCCPPGQSCGFCRRGLACSSCNTLIGQAQDNPARLRRIADSLEFAITATSIRLAAKPVQEAFDLAET